MSSVGVCASQLVSRVEFVWRSVQHGECGLGIERLNMQFQGSFDLLANKSEKIREASSKASEGYTTFSASSQHDGADSTSFHVTQPQFHLRIVVPRFLFGPLTRNRNFLSKRDETQHSKDRSRKR